MLTGLLQLLQVILLLLEPVLLITLFYFTFQVDTLQRSLSVEDALLIHEAHVFKEDHFILLLLGYVLTPCLFFNGSQALFMALLHLG